MNQYLNMIDIYFSYNGDLGKLQTQSQANYYFAHQLFNNGLITGEEYENLKLEIREYFKTELQKAVDRSDSILNK